jgi:murein DD-endopeptidase MepM/ murein hydrolase activator NlpD
MELKERITKKNFGTYVTPQNSPVTPEVFTGYHTALDIEFGDIEGDVPVHAITAGSVVYSGWVSGYGGLTIIKHSIDNRQYNVVYGHLRTSDLLPVGTRVSPNQVIGYLGNGYSRDTDNERKHLHFGIPKSQDLEFLGYVPNESDLSGWVNPLTWY